ncbi:MAG: hypothetical protein JWQ73_3899 [Variovorax sp.]|jgi:hypothetical protein|nr:hypothetical protein [Variovorax sp.]
MQSPDLEALKKAKAMLDELVMSRYVDFQSPPEISITEFGGLSASEQQAERDNANDHDLGNRVRAAIHLCLSASSVAMEVSAKLMGDFADLSGEARANLLGRCAEDAAAASDAAEHAAAVLNNEERPQTEAFFEISRFGQ